jgi:hypothetical protein
MDNTLVCGTGNCGSIPYRGAKFRIATANLKTFTVNETKRCYPVNFNDKYII